MPGALMIVRNAKATNASHNLAMDRQDHLSVKMHPCHLQTEKFYITNESSIKMLTLTRWLPKLSTTQLSAASRPTATVTFGTGSAKETREKPVGAENRKTVNIAFKNLVFYLKSSLIYRKMSQVCARVVGLVECNHGLRTLFSSTSLLSLSPSSCLSSVL